MEAINHIIRTYYQQKYFATSIKSLGLRIPARDYWKTGDASVAKVRLSPGHPVESFRDLVKLTAQIALWNKRYDIFFRGQAKDYLDKNKKTVIYPGICRPEKGIDGKPKASIRTSTIEHRHEELQEFVKFHFKRRSGSFNEPDYALVQHYEILPTPLIDITQSLRVAASFALRDSDTGYLYVFGLPYLYGRVSHFLDLDMVLIKLQNVCPTDAHRPRYQEGFLVGRLPFEPYKAAGDNLAKRLLCKFRLNNSNNNFWDEHFLPIPDDLLFPPQDEYKEKLAKSYEDFKKVWKPKK